MDAKEAGSIEETLIACFQEWVSRILDCCLDIGMTLILYGQMASFLDCSKILASDEKIAQL